jgi:hypothetical protein
MNAAQRAHSIRFRKVSIRYPRRVTEAYGGDAAAAARDDDATVAKKVRQWELANGVEPRDWVKIGQVERDEVQEGDDDDVPLLLQ